ncbi:MAG: hypothetical protein A2X49_02230 [Lentisphaerae bacterium GWF2_52_8]|nr:MAG: hypothetical protein A2X49_02230 [Lentisphaerae bacterium GWF2_52_8]
MGKEAAIREKLTRVVDYCAGPALLLSPSKGLIISSNAAALRTYGQAFSERRPLAFGNFTEELGITSFHRLEWKDEGPAFEPCKKEEASFELIMFSKSLGVAFELAPAANSGSRPHGGQGGIAPFHFSYIHNLANGAWSYANPELLSSLGFIAAGKGSEFCDWRRLIVPEDLPVYDNIISAARQHGGNHEIHYRIRTENGMIIQICDYCSVPSTPEGQWPLLVGSVVSENKSQLERQTAERQVLVGRLVSGMVHDFKNLLGGIQNIIEWSIPQAQGNEPLVASLKKTVSYTEQAAKLISGALKLSSGKRQASIERLDIGDVILDLEDLLRRVLPSSIRLELSIEPGLPPVYGQRSLLQDLLLNLCVNARDAMVKKGRALSIEVLSCTRPAERGDEQEFISLRVKDDGCGMSESELKTIFDAFYSTKERGAGLGLWMVREAVHAFDGKISVESKEGEGTCFEILLPLIEREVPPSQKNTNLPPEKDSKPQTPFRLKETKTVLLIEDDPLIRGGVATWLESLGFRILESGDGLEGLEMFCSRPNEIDLVIQDYILPGKRGDDLLVELIKARPEIPVIVASANPDDDKIAELKRRGAHAFLPKPFRMDDLLDLLRGIFNK